jgi:hypothetical protein
MHCDTSSRPRIDLTLHSHPRAVHAECLRFIKGIRGHRIGHVSRKQIGNWMRATPSEAIDAALIDLISEGKIATRLLNLRSPRNAAKRRYGYEAVR